MQTTRPGKSGSFPLAAFFLLSLTLLFIGLKLAGPLAHWSWLWVLSPLLLQLAGCLLVLILLGLVVIWGLSD